MSNHCVTVAVCSETGDPAEAVLSRWGGDGCGDASPLRRSLVARCLLRMLFEQFTGTDGTEWTFETDGTGKPFAVHPSGIAAPQISISHSGTMVAAAATRSGRLGVDIERHRCGRQFAEIAAYAFGTAEAAEAARSQRAFYRIWTMREAMAKAVGRGLAMAADGRDRVNATPDIGCWVRDIDGVLWHAAHFEPVPDYSLAIAILADRAAQPLRWSEDAIEWLCLDGSSSQAANAADVELNRGMN